MPAAYAGYAAALLLGAGMAMQPAAAQAEEARKRFDIDAGPALRTVAEFGKQAGLNILAGGDALKGVRTNAVRGWLPPAKALAQLLAGTGLAGHFHAGDAVFLTAAPPPATPKKVAGQDGANGIEQVLVTGARAAQQSSIDIKKHAATAVDVVVAEDVGVFPDRNVAEALSRLPGLSLERGDFGEGRNVDVRGNGAARMRIEVDGMALLAAGGTDMNLGGGGRGVELRELSSDSIASITVLKGATPDMTEGSLDGGILIKTRTGLDFKQRHLSLRAAGTRTSLNGIWTPNLNLVYADKFLDGRLGLLFNVTRVNLRNEGHFNQNAISGLAGYLKSADFDNAPQKTFTFQPRTVAADPAARQPLFRAAQAGGGAIDFESTHEVLEKSAAAASKEACFAAFPAPSAAQLASMASESVRNAARGFRSDALLTCLNQWNDYTPSFLRNIVKRNDDRRLNADLRLDFKVNRELSLFARGMKTDRTVLDEFAALDRGGATLGGGSFQDIDGRRLALPGSGTGIVGGYSRSGYGVVQGVASNIVPASVSTDASHHVTGMTVNDAAYFVDNIYNPMVSNSRYVQAGGAWRAKGWRADFMASRSRAEFSRADVRLNGVGYFYGQARLSALPDGSWGFGHAGAAPDQGDAAPYAAMLPPASALAPSLSQVAVLNFTPKMAESGERQFKLDLGWRPRLAAAPFLGELKWGLSSRRQHQTAWNASTGVTVAPEADGKPAVLLPASQVRTDIHACQQGSMAGAEACPAYGYTAGTGLFVRRGGYVMRPAEFAGFLGQVLGGQRTSAYFHGADQRPAGLLQSWTELDVAKALALLDLQTVNLDCLKSCTASDGKVYRQPSSGYREQVTAGYWMADADFEDNPFTGRPWPWGMELGGNIGVRYVHTRVHGRGQLVFQSIVKTAAWSAAQPYAPAGVKTSSVRQDTLLASADTDFMPMLNLMLWPLKDHLVLRYSRHKAIARQPVGNLLPDGSCTYDQVVADANAAGGTQQDMACTGAFGNPGLKPESSINQNLSLEWYPDRNTLLSVSAYRLRGLDGAPRRVQVDSHKLFEGTGARDPVTGASLGDTTFTHSTLVNGPGQRRTGWEVGGKLLFAHAPWLLRYTGLDANYSRTRPESSAHMDLLTGDVLDTQYVPRSAWNASLWYDDGRFSARMALQVVGGMYTTLAPGSRNATPMEGVVEVWNQAGGAATGRRTLKAGDLVRLSGQGLAPEVRRDPHEIARRLAWKDGQLVFANHTLAEAVSEFNRYSARQIVIADPALAGKTLVGRYRTDAPDVFAQAVSAFLHVPVSIGAERIVIGRVPRGK